MPNITQIPDQRVPVLDADTGRMSFEWYMFFVNQDYLTGGGSSDITIEDLQSGPVNNLSDFASSLAQEIQGASLEASGASTAANSALAILASIADSLALLATSPQIQIGTMGEQQASNVNIDGGDIGGVTLSGIITNTATVNGGTYDAFTMSGAVTSTATVGGGTYNAYTMTGAITNSGTVSGGTYSAPTLTGTITNSGTISGGNVSGATITTGSVVSNVTDNQNTLAASSTTLADVAAAATATLTNAPHAGDPTKWVTIDDNGTPRDIPTW